MSNMSHLPGVDQGIGKWIDCKKKKKTELFSLTGCKNLPTVPDHALFSTWLRDLMLLILFSGDSSNDNRRWVKIPTFTYSSFDLKMRNWPRHGALISIMSRKWIDAPRDDFSSLYLISPLIVFTVLWHRLNLETAPSKNATSLRWYRTVSALWARLSSFWSSLTLSFKVTKGTRLTS